LIPGGGSQGLVTQEAERRYLLLRLAEVAPDTE
jgi:hypothetical protein